jgi:hypothetical protein
MADLATLQAWLIAAETAKHNLLTGSLRQTVRYNGQQEVTFAKTDIGALDTYIASLRAQIGGIEGDARKVSRPIHFTF